MLDVISTVKDSREGTIVIDGVPISKDLGRASKLLRNDTMSVYINDATLVNRVVKKSFEDISKKIIILHLSYSLGFNDYINEIEVKQNYYGQEEIFIEYNFSWDIERWKSPFSIEEFAGVMETVVAAYKDQCFEWVQEDEIISNGCHIRYNFVDKIETIESVLERNIPIIKEITEKVDNLLLKYSKEYSLVRLFNFPEEVRVACEQYLLYFGVFLENIGINAITGVSHESGKALFSVTPESEETALEQLNMALEIYLQLPDKLSSMSFESAQLNPKEQQLLSNIDHLKGQLRLAHALSETQRETIQNQRVIIKQQQDLIASSVLQQSLVGTEVLNDDQEEVLGGFASITNYEGNGFQVNFPNIYRWFKKRMFNNGEKN